jgi:glycosyltransferase involved in cell wall biosynthesis
MNARLLYLTGQLGPGGSERQLYLLLEAMDRERYRPLVVVWNYRADDHYVPLLARLGIPVRALPAGMPRTAKLQYFRRIVLEVQPEVVHSYTFHTNVAAAWGVLGRQIIAIGSVRSDFVSELQRSGFLLGPISGRWPRTQIFNSFASAEKAKRSIRLFVPQNIHVVRNGLHLEQYQKVPFRLEKTAQIVGIGSLLAIKQWGRLIRAAAALRRLGHDLTVEIAGGGPMRAALEEEARKLGVDDRVRLVGHTNDIPGLLASSTFLAHTSDYEGCPNSVIEAMAAGRAVVATDVGDVPRIVEDGTTGFVVRRENEAELVDRLATLIMNRDLCVRLGTAGRAKAQREFTVKRLLEETLAVYRAAGWRDSNQRSADDDNVPYSTAGVTC